MCQWRTIWSAFIVLTLLAGCRTAAAERSVASMLPTSSCPAETAALSATDEGSGRPLVMLGGVLTGASGLTSLADRLVPHRRVIRLQNLNVEAALTGAALPIEYGVRSESCGMLAALDRLGLQAPVDLVGYSYGGLIALDFALRHPGRVRSITLVEPPARWVLSGDELRSPEQVRFAEAATAVARRSPTEREAAAFVCIVFGCGTGDELERARQLPLWPAALRNRRALAGVYSTVEYRAPAAPAALAVPLLYVSGSGTSAFHRMINVGFSRVLPQGRYLELPGGHAVPSVSPAALAAAILEFTAR